MHSSEQPAHSPSARGSILKVCWWRSVCILYPMLCLVTLPEKVEMLKARCGRELVADLEFVCGDRGFYRGKVAGLRSGLRLKGKGIVEQCCLRGCDLQHLEAYCAKPRRSRRHIPLTPHLTVGEHFQALFRKRILALYIHEMPQTAGQGRAVRKNWLQTSPDRQSSSQGVSLRKAHYGGIQAPAGL